MGRGRWSCGKHRCPWGGVGFVCLLLLLFFFFYEILNSCRSISTAPPRGGGHFLCCCKESNFVQARGHTHVGQFSPRRWHSPKECPHRPPRAWLAHGLSHRTT